jgi:hypothetical protein
MACITAGAGADSGWEVQVTRDESWERSWEDEPWWESEYAESVGALGDVSVGPWLASPLSYPYALGQGLGWWGDKKPSDVFPHVSDIPQYIPKGVRELPESLAKSTKEAAEAASKIPQTIASLPGDVIDRLDKQFKDTRHEAAQTIKTVAVIGAVAIVGTILLVSIAKM